VLSVGPGTAEQRCRTMLRIAHLALWYWRGWDSAYANERQQRVRRWIGTIDGRRLSN